MNSDEPFKEVNRPGNEHVWPPILDALSKIPDFPETKSEEWKPYILSDPPPEKIGGLWYKKKITVFPPQPPPKID